MFRTFGVLSLAMLLGLAASARASAMLYHLSIKNETSTTQRIAFHELECMSINAHSGGYEIAPHQVWNGTMVTTILGTGTKGQPCNSNEVPSSFWLLLDGGPGGAVQLEKYALKDWEIVKRHPGRYLIDGRPGLWLHLTIR